MDAPPPENLSPAWPDDTRTPIPRMGGERETLTAFLDWHRATFALRCSGLTSDQLAQRSITPSGMSLHGLLRHLAAVERWWFRQQFTGEDVAALYFSDDAPNDDFDALDGEPEQAWATWRDECDRAREIVRSAASLDAAGTALMTGEPFSLRWVMMQMITEYARHNGHADLLRERLDGAVGY